MQRHAGQRIAESHLQSISNVGENQATEEEDELGELRELGYPREEEEEEAGKEEEEFEIELRVRDFFFLYLFSLRVP